MFQSDVPRNGCYGGQGAKLMDDIAWNKVDILEWGEEERARV